MSWKFKSSTNEVNKNKQIKNMALPYLTICLNKYEYKEKIIIDGMENLFLKRDNLLKIFPLYCHFCGLEFYLKINNDFDSINCDNKCYKVLNETKINLND